MYSDNAWRQKEGEPALVEEISRSLGITTISARLIAQRGMKSPEEARRFFCGELKDLSSPYTLSGMERARQRIIQAMERKEKIMIFGDYDVDGISSTVLMVEAFALLGYPADYHVPDRFKEGYGLNIPAIRCIAARGYQLLITVDCGISSVEEIQEANRLGLDVIVTDHHTPSEILPPACAIINPKLDPAADQYLAGAGVAYKLVTALCQERVEPERLYRLLDLVALATVADIVPLLGDNRIMVKHGLKVMEAFERPGLKALALQSGLLGKRITSWHIGFILGPRLNAAGRINHAQKSIELLRSRDEAVVQPLAAELCRFNKERKEIEEGIHSQILQELAGDAELEQKPLLILDGDNWHQGVIGIVASRLVDRFFRPVILISWDDSGQGKGSGRSLPGFNLYEALHRQASCLEGYGGHSMAVGLTLDRQHYDRFKAAMLKEAGMADLRDMHKQIAFDGELSRQEIDEALLQELKQFEPFGEGNPEPVFSLRAVDLQHLYYVGKNREHARIKLGSIDAIAFNQAGSFGSDGQDYTMDLLFHIQENEYRQQKKLQLKVIDAKPAFQPDCRVAQDVRATEKIAKMERVIRELRQKKPVLFLYPTHRSMQQHEKLLQYFVKPSLLEAAHGHLNTVRGRAVARAFGTGVPGVYLMTQAFLYSFLQQQEGLPQNLAYILTVRPQDLDRTLLGSLGERSIDLETLSDMDPVIRWKKAQLEDSDFEHSLIYANRAGTVKKLREWLPGIQVEAGIQDFQHRKSIRKRFPHSKSCILVSDGNYSTVYSRINRLQQLVLADVPFGRHEIAFLLEQLAHPLAADTLCLFEKSELAWNRAFLNRLYPEENTIRLLWQHLCRSGKKPMVGEAAGLAAAVAAEYTAHNLLAGLHVLEDLGLCQVQKKGSIIEIKTGMQPDRPFDLSRSPYFMEGIYAHENFDKWESELNTSGMW